MYIQYIIRALIAIFSMFLVAKVIGSRQISEVSLFDYINGITIGSIAAEIVISEDKTWPLLLVLVLYGIVTIFISWAADKSLVARRFIEGRPKVLFQNEKFLYKNMKKCKIDLCEFLMLCREQGYFDLSEIQCAILESNGKMSILPKMEYRPVTPFDMDLKPERENVFANIIMEGKIMSGNLKSIGRDENWMKKQMQMHNIADEKEVFLAVCDGSDQCYFFPKLSASKSIDKLL